MSDVPLVDSVDLEAVIVETSDGFLKYEPRCATCNSPHRIAIETWKLAGWKTTEIIAKLEKAPGLGIGITPRAMRDHFSNGHCGSRADLFEQQWADAARQGVDIDEFEDTVNLSALVARLTIAQFRKRIIDGALQPDFKDGLAAAKMLHDLEKAQGEASDYDPKDMFIAISVLMSHVNAVLNRYLPNQADVALDYFSRLLRADPILKDLIAKTRTLEVDDFTDEEAVPAELIEETEEVDTPVQVEYDGPAPVEEDDWFDPSAPTA